MWHIPLEVSTRTCQLGGPESLARETSPPATATQPQKLTALITWRYHAVSDATGHVSVMRLLLLQGFERDRMSGTAASGWAPGQVLCKSRVRCVR